MRRPRGASGRDGAGWPWPQRAAPAAGRPWSGLAPARMIGRRTASIDVRQKAQRVALDESERRDARKALCLGDELHFL